MGEDQKSTFVPMSANRYFLLSWYKWYEETKIIHLGFNVKKPKVNNIWWTSTPGSRFPRDGGGGGIPPTPRKATL